MYNEKICQRLRAKIDSSSFPDQENNSIQFMKNTRYHRRIGMSPYEAFFGMKPRLGLANLNLDKEVTDQIWTEEQLNEVLEEAPIEYQIEAPGSRYVIDIVQDQVSAVAEGEVADEIEGDSEECHLCAANGELCGLC